MKKHIAVGGGVLVGAIIVRMGYNPSRLASCGADCPVEQVSWHEAAAYCNALSSATGLASCYTCTGSRENVTCSPSTSYAKPYDCSGYRLPTEAEWEYAARAGTATATYNGNLDAGHLGCEEPNGALDSIAWFCGNSGSATHAVGTRTPNAWGLYDMLGNVHELCHDWYGSYPSGAVTDPWGPVEGSGRGGRGGSWGSGARFARAADRGIVDPGHRNGYLGFRPARSLAPSAPS